MYVTFSRSSLRGKSFYNELPLSEIIKSTDVAIQSFYILDCHVVRFDFFVITQNLMLSPRNDDRENVTYNLTTYGVINHKIFNRISKF
jgi:hypothetical protein